MNMGQTALYDCHMSQQSELVVYMLVNLATDMVYIGQSWDFKARMKTHWSSARRRDSKASTTRLTRTMREYNKHCWEAVILERFTPSGDFEADQRMLDSAEDYWIDYTSAADPNVGYNERDRHRNAQARGAAKPKRTRPTPELSREYGRLSVIRDPILRAKKKAEIETRFQAA